MFGVDALERDLTHAGQYSCMHIGFGMLLHFEGVGFQVVGRNDGCLGIGAVHYDYGFWVGKIVGVHGCLVVVCGEYFQDVIPSRRRVPQDKKHR